MPTMKAGDHRLEVRVPTDLYDDLVDAAREEERSLNRMALLFLRRALRDYKAERLRRVDKDEDRA